MMKKELLLISLLLLLSFPAVKALLQPGGYTSHDMTDHIIRQISMDDILSEGQFPPRWSGDLNQGYGYPVFLFNYPLPALIAEIFHKLGFNFVYSLKAVLFSSMIVSVFAMYFFLKELLGSKMAASLGAIFYLYAPIRFLNVYVSAAIGSALALAFVPFIFWSIVKLSKKVSYFAVLVGSISLTALITSHNVTALIFAPVILAFAWVVGRRKGMKEIGIMFLIGFGLSAWFWIPATFERQYIRFDEFFSSFYKDQFPSLWQLLRSPWGYGLSHPERPEPGDMSYQLGLIHITVILVYGLWFMVYGRKNKDNILGVFVLTTFFLSIFLILRISLPLWDNTPFLSLVQFPLRFSAIAIFSASIAAALLVKYLPFKKVVFISLLLLVLYANRNHLNINQVFDPGERYYLELKRVSSNFGEHLPKWGRVAVQPANGKLEFISGDGEIKMIKSQSAHILAQVEATTSARLRLNQFYFPGWEIEVDEKKVEFNYLISGESYGLPMFDIDEGTRKIEAQFKNTPIRNLSDTTSLVAWLAWMIMLMRIIYIKIKSILR
ncbi:MAG: hypothetical protein AAB414_04575 [Patescibacteria group bacterium]